jgi:glutamine amidotransferase
VRKGLTAAGAEISTPAAAADLAGAAGIVIPGVGHFGATRAIDASWRSAILAAVDRGVPLLGICLGMQFLFEGSEEAPGIAGLGLLRGRCELLPSSVKVPHAGWNTLKLTRGSTLLESVPDGAYVYFTHSFAAPLTPDAIAVAEHGTAFAAAVERGRVSGVQFHPEKSSDAGLRILRSFVTLTRSSHPQIGRSTRC